MDRWEELSPDEFVVRFKELLPPTAPKFPGSRMGRDQLVRYWWRAEGLSFHSIQYPLTMDVVKGRAPPALPPADARAWCHNEWMLECFLRESAPDPEEHVLVWADGFWGEPDEPDERAFSVPIATWPEFCSHVGLPLNFVGDIVVIASRTKTGLIVFHHERYEFLGFASDAQELAARVERRFMEGHRVGAG